MKRPTFASVTDVPCTCGYLEQAADDARTPIAFDTQCGRYQFRYREPGRDGHSMLLIYHCPFCGGAAPASKAELVFAVIPPDEEERLTELLAPVRSVADALKTLGEPSTNVPSATRDRERDGHAPWIELHRTLIYDTLSDVADVWVMERPDGSVACRLQGKYIGPQSHDAGA